ncbi:hypothetical protein BDV96DRAFT_150786 [Lophiotrema nucula]|uniref:Uncharacterized protein n=1 Tax=Lophiotrema nucula TaxID=690887 RepID=A0A6A5Z2I7_9PLEO|nr:hypothetical protein BDV96DRAFT_150786 [Lophiotrema nucula]
MAIRATEHSTTVVVMFSMAASRATTVFLRFIEEAPPHSLALQQKHVYLQPESDQLLISAVLHIITSISLLYARIAIKVASKSLRREPSGRLQRVFPDNPANRAFAHLRGLASSSALLRRHADTGTSCSNPLTLPGA